MGGRIYTTRRPILVHGIGFANLNGSSQFFYRTDADFPEADITGDLSLSGWIRPSGVSGYQVIVSRYHSPPNRAVIFTLNNDEIAVFLGTNGTSTVSKTTAAMNVIANVWTHIAITYDASAGTVEVYKNGAWVEQLSGYPNAIFSCAPPFSVGRMAATTWLFNGSIANIAYFDDIRTAPEIAASAADFGIDLSGEGNLIGQWIFDELPSATAIDNKQTDAGRDLIPYDGGNVAFKNLRQWGGKPIL